MILLADKFISATALTEDLLNKSFYPAIVKRSIEEAPAVDAVSRDLFEQIKWERDIAMEQLAEHGIPLGAKMNEDIK